MWQYTATDVASAYTWGELHLTPKNPSSRWTSELARRVADELAQRGWRMEAVMTDNASEFRSKYFNRTLVQLDTKHIYIRPGRPQSNGCVEAGSADHPPRVLEAELRALPHAQIHRPAP